MKRSIAILFTILSLIAFGQDEPTCFQKYAKAFEVRGANEVPDGTYEQVVISVRKGSFADCFMGKVVVKNGVIVRSSIQLTFVDGSYEPLKRAYKSDGPINIINGMSKTLLTEDEELINIMFVNAIKPKKKAFKKAPDPDFDL